MKTMTTCYSEQDPFYFKLDITTLLYIIPHKEDMLDPIHFFSKD